MPCNNQKEKKIKMDEILNDILRDRVYLKTKEQLDNSISWYIFKLHVASYITTLNDAMRLHFVTSQKKRNPFNLSTSVSELTELTFSGIK